MNWKTNDSNLRDVLAGLYYRNTDIDRILHDAEINPAYIDLSGNAIGVWGRVLEHAINGHKRDKVIDAALKEFPDFAPLLSAREDKLQTAVPKNDRVEWKSDDSYEKIMGEQSSLLPISFLEVGLERAKSVVLIRRGDNTTGSGFVTSGNLLITNHHVLEDKEQAKNCRVLFNVQRNSANLDRQPTEIMCIPDQGFATSPEDEDDWTAVRIGPGGEEWGCIPLAETNVAPKDRVNIIQHPAGGTKQIALYHNVVTFVDDRILQYLTDTLPGSSGSPVFDNDWNVVGLHHRGGWLQEPGTRSKELLWRNQGVRMNAVIKGIHAAGL